MHRWHNKVAIVTGASAGIGAAICEKLVECGIKVVGLARRKTRVEELAKTLKNKRGELHAVQTDITKEEDILNAFEWTTKNVGPLHILVNNAGIIKNSSLLDGKTEDWKSIIDTNVMGLCIATREAFKIMKENNIDGHIIHLNSLAGHFVPTRLKLNIYTASKFAVTALTETLRIELNQLGLKIKITSISPSYVKSEIFEESGVNFPQSVPFLEAKDIADVVRYTLSTPPHVQINEVIIRPL